MRYAETGYNLEIDLARGNIERVETDPKMTELHLGGLGTSVKIHWDRVPAETEAFDPDNLLIFSTGLFNGTPAFSANRTVVTFISPQSGLLAYPMMGGFWSGQTHLDYTPSLDGTFKYLAEIVHIPPGPETFGLDAPSF